ncbi:MAG TPA: sugar phosphate isomerase/epimerase family protein [Bryobacteraceae bacterium]|nr:sugar phosphate isomerase/epimerase family protein [Bryobacteraceae bacterium]
MAKLQPFEIGVIFWAGRDPRETLSELTALGIRSGQIGIPGDLDIASVEKWKSALDDARFAIYTAVAAFEGESYADVPTVLRTVGFIPPETRDAREQRMKEVAGFGARVGARGIATHIGFVPEDPGAPDYIAVRDVVRRICDYAAKLNLTFALETGQERAEVLLRFIRDVDRPNLGINFDPANMILYGTGDPIEALRALAPHVFSVHCKDGDWPPPGNPNALGEERPLGAGAVGVERFLRELARVGYRGPLAIEREASDPAARLRDIASAVALLRATLQKLPDLAGIREQ